MRDEGGSPRSVTVKLANPAAKQRPSIESNADGVTRSLTYRQPLLTSFSSIAAATQWRQFGPLWIGRSAGRSGLRAAGVRASRPGGIPVRTPTPLG